MRKYILSRNRKICVAFDFEFQLDGGSFHFREHSSHDIDRECLVYGICGSCRERERLPIDMFDVLREQPHPSSVHDERCEWSDDNRWIPKRSLISKGRQLLPVERSLLVLDSPNSFQHNFNWADCNFSNFSVSWLSKCSLNLKYSSSNKTRRGATTLRVWCEAVSSGNNTCKVCFSEIFIFMKLTWKVIIRPNWAFPIAINYGNLRAFRSNVNRNWKGSQSIITLVD